MNVSSDFAPPPPSRRGLGCIGWSLILAGICVAACAGLAFIGYRWFGNAFTTDSARVREITATIADFTPPEKMRPIFGIDMNFGVTKIQAGVYNADDGLPMVMLMQFAGISEDDAERQLDQMGSQFKNFVPKATIERPVTIRGREAKATIQTGEWRGEAAADERQPTTKASAGFEGRGGTANVIVVVPGDDDAAIDAAVSLLQTVK